MIRRLPIALAALAGLFASGCMSFHREAPKPGLTIIGLRAVTLPCHVLDNVIVVEAKWDKFGPYRFVIDTGSSVTLVSPELAGRYASDSPPAAGVPPVRVRSAEGGFALLRPVTLKKIQLGGARFEFVPALVYDCADVSAQFDVKIDGILGFPLFRSVVLTLDYPHERVVLRSRIPDEGLPGEAILFDNADKTPLIPVRLADRQFAALIDSGSSAAIAINPAGIAPKFQYGPVDGPAVSTLTGDRPSKVGRLADVVRLGSFDIPRPVAEITDELSSLGGGVLSHFTVTFDQEDDEVFFQHESSDSLAVPPLRGTGLSFRKTPAYWKVAGAMRGSPAAAAGVGAGDLVSRIDGEPVAGWDLPRYRRLVSTADRIDFTFIEGAQETTKSIAVVDLVP
ncbi:MAG: retropepsin-like aspartic protease [Opitutaceae bacterium]|jgi:hypothetical protein